MKNIINTRKSISGRRIAEHVDFGLLDGFLIVLAGVVFLLM